MPSADDVRRQRRAAAALAARQYLDGVIGYEDLRASCDETDRGIDEMLDLIAHMPARRSLFGASDSVWSSYRTEVLEMVRKLEAS